MSLYSVEDWTPYNVELMTIKKVRQLYATTNIVNVPRKLLQLCENPATNLWNVMFALQHESNTKCTENVFQDKADL